jgi:integrase
LEVVDFNGDAGTVAIRKSKTGKARHVVLTDEGMTFFRSITAGRAGADLMFHRADGRAWDSSNQGRPMREACARAGIVPSIGFHQLRHTWAAEPRTDEDVRRRRASANRVLTYLKAALNQAYDEKQVATNEAWGRRMRS